MAELALNGEQGYGNRWVILERQETPESPEYDVIDGITQHHGNETQAATFGNQLRIAHLTETQMALGVGTIHTQNRDILNSPTFQEAHMQSTFQEAHMQSQAEKESTFLFQPSIASPPQSMKQQDDKS